VISICYFFRESNVIKNADLQMNLDEKITSFNLKINRTAIYNRPKRYQAGFGRGCCSLLYFENNLKRNVL